MRKPLVAIATLLALTACGNSDHPDAPKASATTKAPVKVSIAAACSLLYNGEGVNTEPMLKLIAYVGKSATKEQATVDDAKAIIAELKDIASRSPAVLATQVDALVTTTEELLTALKTGDEWSAADFKASGYDINSQCKPYVE